MVLEEIQYARSSIQTAIERYGHAPEHRLDWYSSIQKPTRKLFAALGSDTALLLTYKEKNEWYIFSEPLAPDGVRGRLIIEFAEEVLQDHTVKKVVTELRASTRKDVLNLLPKNLRACAINYTLTWPVMDMNVFDPALPGKKYKHIRNAHNKFYREHAIEMIDARSVPQGELLAVITRWQKNRGARDRAYTDEFISVIENNFYDMPHAEAMRLDGQIVGMNVGWPMPGDSQSYYGAIGIHDYSHPDLGMMLYLADLEWFKKRGIQCVDMGGGEKALTVFKNQFSPARWYKTFVFSIVRNEK